MGIYKCMQCHGLTVIACQKNNVYGGLRTTTTLLQYK